MDDGETAVPIPCESCGEEHTGAVYETIVYGRLHWVLAYTCRGVPVEAMGWHETPADFRQAILAQQGTFRLRATGEKLALLRVLRTTGVAVPEISAMLADLGDPGLPGTETELKLLAGRFRAAGAAPRVDRES